MTSKSLKNGIKVEHEHRDLYLKLKAMLEKQGVEMPISETEFYATIARVHLKEEKDYYDLLMKYVEKKEKGGWIQNAIKHKGALRKTAMQQGLIKEGENLSLSDLKKLEAQGGTTAKRANLARTLRKFEQGGTLNPQLTEQEYTVQFIKDGNRSQQKFVVTSYSEAIAKCKFFNGNNIEILNEK
jgi:hypothetical protein